MPINKFGHHYLYESIPHKLTAAAPAATSLNLSSYRSVCILTLRGTPQSDSLTLKFENNSNVYKFEINGTIQQVDSSIDSIQFVLNKSDLILPNDLVGTAINKGDFIKVYRDISQPTQPVFIQFLLLCPLIKDE